MVLISSGDLGHFPSAGCPSAPDQGELSDRLLGLLRARPLGTHRPPQLGVVPRGSDLVLAVSGG